MIDSLKTTLNGYLVSNSQLTVPKVYQCDRSIPKHLAIKITGQEQGSLSSRRGTKSKAVPLAFDSGMWQVISAKYPTSLSASFWWKDDFCEDPHYPHTLSHTQMFVKNCRIMLDSWILCWINRGNWFPSCAAEQRVPELGPNRDQVTATDVDQALLKPFHSPLDCQNYLTAVFRQVVSKSFIGVFVSKQFIHSFGSLRNDIYAACLVPLPMGSTIQHI